MSRDDPVGTHRVPLGECDCPTTPHTDGDWADVLDKRDYAGFGVVSAMGVNDALFLLRVVASGITEWNLVTKGEAEGTLFPLPITEANVNRLAMRQKLILLNDINADSMVATLESGFSPPNPPGALSEDTRAKEQGSRTSRRKTATR